MVHDKDDEGQPGRFGNAEGEKEIKPAKKMRGRRVRLDRSICQQCGKPYLPKHMRNMTCSHRCSILRTKFNQNMIMGRKTISKDIVPYKYRDMFKELE